MKRIIGGKEYDIVNEEEIRENPDGSVTINRPDGTLGVVTTTTDITWTTDTTSTTLSGEFEYKYE